MTKTDPAEATHRPTSDVEAELVESRSVIRYLLSDLSLDFAAILLETQAYRVAIDGLDLATPVERLHAAIDFHTARPMAALGNWLAFPNGDPDALRQDWIDRMPGLSANQADSMTSFSILLLGGVLMGQTADTLHERADLFALMMGLDRPLEESDNLAGSNVCTKIVDIDGTLRFMSRAGVEALGIDDISELYGNPYPFDFYPDESQNLIRTAIAAAGTTGMPQSQPAAAINDVDGNELWFRSAYAAIQADDGTIDSLVIVSQQAEAPDTL